MGNGDVAKLGHQRFSVDITWTGIFHKKSPGMTPNPQDTLLPQTMGPRGHEMDCLERPRLLLVCFLAQLALPSVTVSS
jgi:hypothetical protein